MQLNKNNILYIFTAILVVIYCLVEAQGRGDLYIYLSASSDLSRNEDVFLKSYIDGYHYYYSLLFALLIKPFVFLPYYWVKFYWLLINCAMVFVMFRWMYFSKMVQSLNSKHRNWFMFISVVFSARMIHENIHVSQVTILILFLTVSGLRLIVSEKAITGSLLLAMAINIKLLAVVLIPYLIWRKHLKAFFWAILFYTLFLFIPSLFIGHDYNIQLLHSWLSLINPTNTIHVLDVDERSFHGLTTLLSTLLVKNVPDYHALGIRRNIADVPIPTLSLIINIVRLFFIAITLFYLRTMPFKKAKNDLHVCFEISFILLLIPLIFPHQQHYAFLFAMPAIFVCVYCIFLKLTLSKEKISSLYYALLGLVFLTYNLKLLLGNFNQYYEHFKILTWGTLLLIPVHYIFFNKTWKQN